MTSPQALHKPPNTLSIPPHLPTQSNLHLLSQIQKPLYQLPIYKPIRLGRLPLLILKRAVSVEIQIAEGFNGRRFYGEVLGGGGRGC